MFTIIVPHNDWVYAGEVPNMIIFIKKKPYIYICHSAWYSRFTGNQVIFCLIYSLFSAVQINWYTSAIIVVFLKRPTLVWFYMFNIFISKVLVELFKAVT